jgi:hypothetical protein
VLFPLALIISGTLSVRLLMVTLAAIAIPQLIFVWTSGDPGPVPGPQALFEITFPWLAGHALFNSPTLASVALALAFALSYAGGLRMAQDWPGLMRWNLGQIAAVIVLVALRQPLVAGIAGMLFFCQSIIQPGLFDAETDEVEFVAAAHFLRTVQPLLMAAMLVAAWGVRVASTGG